MHVIKKCVQFHKNAYRCKAERKSFKRVSMVIGNIDADALKSFSIPE